MLDILRCDKESINSIFLLVAKCIHRLFLNLDFDIVCNFWLRFLFFLIVYSIKPNVIPNAYALFRIQQINQSAHITLAHFVFT